MTTEQQQIKKLKDIKESKEEMVSPEILEEAEKLKETSLKNTIHLSKLFLLCYDVLNVNKFHFKIDGDPVEEKLNIVRKEISIFELRHFLEEYGDGKEICSNYVMQDIKIIINGKRDLVIELINFFFSIFEDDI